LNKKKLQTKQQGLKNIKLKTRVRSHQRTPKVKSFLNRLKNNFNRLKMFSLKILERKRLKKWSKPLKQSTTSEKSTTFLLSKLMPTKPKKLRIISMIILSRKT
jgi:hypothetical protein